MIARSVAARVHAERGCRAFVPPPLPPEFAFGLDLAAELSAADRPIGELSGIGRTLPGAPLFAQSMVLLSSRIEGTEATMSDLALFEVLPPLITIACLHYQFEAIHPFIDGNGRLLVTLLLVEWGLLPSPRLDLSAYIEPRRDEYYQRLLAVSTHGDRSGWVRFFLDVLAHQAQDARNRAEALRDIARRQCYFSGGKSHY